MMARGPLPLAHLADEISRMVGVKVDVAASEALSPSVAATALHELVSLVAQLRNESTTSKTWQVADAGIWRATIGPRNSRTLDTA
jgi:hypothetical protein